jgi:ankyrin repeat protein
MDSKYRGKILPCKTTIRVGKAVTVIRQNLKANPVKHQCLIDKVAERLYIEVPKCLKIVDPECIVCDDCDKLIDSFHMGSLPKCGACGKDLDTTKTYNCVAHCRCTCKHCEHYFSKSYLLLTFYSFLCSLKRLKIKTNRDILTIIFDKVKYDHVVYDNKIHFTRIEKSDLIVLQKLNINNGNCSSNMSMFAPYINNANCPNELFHRIKSGKFIASNIEELEIALKYGLDVNYTDVHGLSLLYYATKHNDIESLKLLLDMGNDPNKRCTDIFVAPLHLATKNNNLECVKLLLIYGANIDIVDGHGGSPLWYAMPQRWKKERNNLNHKLQCFKFLLEEGADPFIQNYMGETIVHYMIDQNLKDYLQVILSEPNLIKLLNIPSKKGMTPLHYAIFTERLDFVKVLLRNGSNPHVISDEGDTLLHYASINKETEYVKSLLQYKVNVNSVNKEGSTPLHMAISYGNPKNMEWLLKAGANVDSKTLKGNTPLHLAVSLSHYKCAKILMRYKPDILAVNNEKIVETPISLAKKKGDRRLSEILLRIY